MRVVCVIIVSYFLIHSCNIDIPSNCPECRWFKCVNRFIPLDLNNCVTASDVNNKEIGTYVCMYVRIRLFAQRRG
ncbi:hypothetical protein C2G38_39519 [Gigaspora rosea]|uniref:Uncharacterized protein n=1 Tax=Gigaspora rosea TaxID=44941 RepID=A0A397UR16_9GLOM|nr:hypothetical protein C2G38_39519 [Gigaspora rosea]